MEGREDRRKLMQRRCNIVNKCSWLVIVIIIIIIVIIIIVIIVIIIIIIINQNSCENSILSHFHVHLSVDLWEYVTEQSVYV